MEWEPIQHLAPVPNDVPWYYLMITIFIGGAIVSYGVATLAKRWEDELSLPNWASVLGDSLGIVLGAAAGGLSGYLVWHWGLGFLSGLAGAVASPWVIARLGEIIKKWKGKE